MKKILIVIGTRPNFIKVTQFKAVAKKYERFDLKIVHTGQHYDNKMADVFFEQFNLIPDFFLNSSTVSIIDQIADTMQKLENLITTEYKPDLMVVVGDVNSTLAGALVANKLNIPLAHLESGLRSHDKTMPEEHNRIITDAISNYFFVTEQSGYDNLINENVAKDSIHFVGNTMIDTLVKFRAEIDNHPVLDEMNLKKKEFVLMTIHRPATVDKAEGLVQLLNLIEKVTEMYTLVFPIHPRTLKNLEKWNLLDRFKNNSNVIATEPLDYFAFQNLVSNCKFILTDSGGIQEESTFLGVPCLTLRPNTERPSTSTLGTNTLIPFDLSVIAGYMKAIRENKYKSGTIPPLWDGQSTERIMKIIDSLI